MQTECLFIDIWGSLITAEMLKQWHGGVCKMSQVLPSVVKGINAMLMRGYYGSLAVCIILSATVHGIRW